MNKEEAIKDLKTLKEFFEERSGATPLSIEYAIEKLDQEPCTDAVSRKAAIDACLKGLNRKEMVANIKALPSVQPKQKMGQFTEWVAREIFDDNWEYNKDAFAELACRKLAKLGIVRAKGNKWELIESRESEMQEVEE